MEWNVADLENGITKVVLTGRLDLQGALAIDPAFARIAEDKLKVVVDLSQVSFLASLGIRTLVMSTKTLAAKGGNLVLMAPQHSVEKVLATSGINTIIPTVADMAAAEAVLLK